MSRRHARIAHRDAKRSWSAREGVVIELSSASGVGRGEASPLPGYSRDDLATCARELDGAWDRIGVVDVDADVRESLRAAVGRSGVTAAAAVFAIESAVLDLVGKARRLPAWAVLRGDSLASSIPLSGLADGETPEALADAASATVARGIEVVKVKVGGEACLTRDPPRLEAIRARLGDRVRLRLDANQTLERAALEAALDAFATFQPELVEEPAAPELVDALRASPVPLAMDESLMREDWRERVTSASRRGTCAALVLKPMSLGGVERCLTLADAAAEAGLAVVFTHLFDGPLATTATACVALAVRARILPCGLDPHGRFERLPLGVSATQIVPFTEAGLGDTPHETEP